MPFNVFLHRSFDYQLFSSPSCILDWAPIRMMVRTTSALNGSNKYEPLLTSSDEETWQMSVTELNYKLNAERNWVQSESKKAQELNNINNKKFEENNEISSSDSDHGIANISASETESPHQVDETAVHIFREANATPSLNHELELHNESRESGVENSGVTSYTQKMINATSSAHTHESNTFQVHESYCNTDTSTSDINKIRKENNKTEEFNATKSMETANMECLCEKHEREPNNSPVLEITQHNHYMDNSSYNKIYNANISDDVAAAAIKTNENVNQVQDTNTNSVISASNAMPGMNNKEDRNHLVKPNHNLPYASDGELLSILIPPRKRWTGEVICQSYGRVPLYKRHSFVILASLYPSIGLSCTKQYERSENMSEIAEGLHFLSEHCTKIGAEQINERANNVQRADTTHHVNTNNNKREKQFTETMNSTLNVDTMKGDNAHRKCIKNFKKEKMQGSNVEQLQQRTNTYVDNRCDDQYINIGQIRTTHSIRSSQILQLEWFYDRLKWRGVCNVRLKPTSLYSPTCPYWHLPCCEYVMQTPWTEWSVQCDEEVLKWSGFLILYKTHPLLLSSSSSSSSSAAAAQCNVPEKENLTLPSSSKLSSSYNNGKNNTINYNKGNADTKNKDKAESHTFTTETKGNVDKSQSPKQIANTEESNKNSATSKHNKTNIIKTNGQNSNSSNLTRVELQQLQESTTNKTNAAQQQKASNRKERTMTKEEAEVSNKAENDTTLLQNKITQEESLSTSSFAKSTTSSPANETKNYNKSVASPSSPPSSLVVLTKQENEPNKPAKSVSTNKKYSANASAEVKEDEALLTTIVKYNIDDQQKNNNVKNESLPKETIQEKDKPNSNKEKSTQEITHRSATSEARTSNHHNKAMYTLEDEPFPRLPHHHWWRLRHLKVGSGLACKRDFKSGMNLYCGFSGECGNGLGFAAHIDVLRRLCCSLTSTTSCPSFPLPSLMHLPSSPATSLEVSTSTSTSTSTTVGSLRSKSLNSSTQKEATQKEIEKVDNINMLAKRNGRLDMAVRLKVNLITFHSTTLEGGLCYYPFPTLYPHLSLRWSYSPHSDNLITPSIPMENNLISNKMFVLEEPISSTSVFGVHIPDITHELFSDWISQHRKTRDQRRLEEQEQQIWQKEEEKCKTEERRKEMEEQHLFNAKGKVGEEKAKAPNVNIENHHTTGKENTEADGKIIASNTSLHEVSGTWFSFGWFPGMVGGWLWSLPTLLSRTDTNDATSTTSTSIARNDKSDSINASHSVAEELHLIDSNSKVIAKNNTASSQLTLHTNRLVDTHFPFIHYTALMHSILKIQHTMLLRCMHLWQTCIGVYRVIRHQLHTSWRYTKSLDWLEETLDGCHVDVLVGVNVYHHRIKFTHPYKPMPWSSTSTSSNIHNNVAITTSSNINTANQEKGFAFRHNMLTQRNRRS